jgi:hypothetical protein
MCGEQNAGQSESISEMLEEIIYLGTTLMNQKFFSGRN